MKNLAKNVTWCKSSENWTFELNKIQRRHGSWQTYILICCLFLFSPSLHTSIHIPIPALLQADAEHNIVFLHTIVKMVGLFNITKLKLTHMPCRQLMAASRGYSAGQTGFYCHEQVRPWGGNSCEPNLQAQWSSPQMRRRLSGRPQHDHVVLLDQKPCRDQEQPLGQIRSWHWWIQPAKWRMTCIRDLHNSPNYILPCHIGNKLQLQNSKVFGIIPRDVSHITLIIIQIR